jgi:DNA polymerase III epsilon subunit family exonuclease
MSTNNQSIKPIDVRNPANLVYLDIETTGLYLGQGARIIEIAMLKISDGEELTFESLVNPGCLVSQQSAKISHISDKMLEGAPKFKEISSQVLDFINGDVLVCHNASFDLSFVCKELADNKYPPQKFLYIDTLMLARKFFNFESNSLGAIADAIGIETSGAHRAMADVLTMFAISKYLFRNMFIRGIDEIIPKIFHFKNP